MSTSTTTADRRLLHARVAVFGVFVAFGLVLGTWATHLPSVKATIDASTSSMGIILLILGVGALAGMQASGYAVDRWGSGCVALAGAAAMALALLPPLLMTTWSSVAGAALILGIAVGIGEVGMNAAAVEVERDYERPIMASFHGMFSVGNVLGALFGAAAFAVGIGTTATALTVSALALIMAAAAAPTLLRRTTTASATTGPKDAGDPGSPPAPRQRVRLVLLGTLAFLLLLTEGSAMDWSSLHAQEHLAGSPSSGALALACFVSAMTVGRFTVDRVAARTGPVRVLRLGSVLAITGLAIVVLSPMLAVTCVGWVILGLGLSGCVPQVFTATGNTPGASAKELSRVVGAGYLAVLAGPAIVGWLADIVGLNTAFVLPIIAMVVCVCAANVLAPPADATT
ncbi:MFS transporter [Rhodococcus sp. UNC23MFCrub1.1]|uniref:MFS transporter n=1 Tax=Rhodococcus sp. UNC23MFCrub1.1 TaxID=1449068 RepID=UPI00068A0EB0|nr:MFS transporter [Rhodococcus sp. UNC23MFCrub1.1]